MRVAAIILAGLTVVQAEPETLTLACEGTTAIRDAKGEPISMTLTLNLFARTVKGFPYPVKILTVDDDTVVFVGDVARPPFLIILGTIDRVTGDLSAIVDSNPVEAVTFYELKCKPIQF